MPKYNGVDVDNPQIVQHIKQMAKLGYSKEEAMKTSGMPYEVVDKYYQQVKDEK